MGEVEKVKLFTRSLVEVAYSLFSLWILHIISPKTTDKERIDYISTYSIKALFSRSVLNIKCYRLSGDTENFKIIIQPFSETELMVDWESLDYQSHQCIQSFISGNRFLYLCPCVTKKNMIYKDFCDDEIINEYLEKGLLFFLFIGEILNLDESLTLSYKYLNSVMLALDMIIDHVNSKKIGDDTGIILHKKVLFELGGENIGLNPTILEYIGLIKNAIGRDSLENIQSKINSIIESIVID